MAKKKHHTTKTGASKTATSLNAQTSALSLQYLSHTLFDIAVIGGGASGLACAIAAAQVAEQQGSRLKIVLLESVRRIGTSIMRSGNGRCNFSHASIDAERYHNASFVSRSFDALEFTTGQTVVSWFERLGLVWEELPGSGGLLYPFSRKANSVLEVLLNALERYGIEVYTSLSVEGAARSNDALIVLHTVCSQVSQASGHTKRSQNHQHSRIEEQEPQACTISAKRVVVANGSAVQASFFDQVVGEEALCTGKFFIPLRPVLAPLKAVPLCDASLKVLDGTRVRARVSLASGAFSEEGEILFREYGVSGIVVFNASRYAACDELLRIDLVPHVSEEELCTCLTERAHMLSAKTASSVLAGFMVEPLAHVLCVDAGIDYLAVPTEAALQRLAHSMKAFTLRIEGIADQRSAQAHRGGVNPAFINPATMQLQDSCVYVLGEALDVDGPCGGYNLHWAWTSGLLAGYDIASSLG